MTSRTEGPPVIYRRAACRPCGQVYDVPTPARLLRCPACGGGLLVVAVTALRVANGRWIGVRAPVLPGLN